MRRKKIISLFTLLVVCTILGGCETKIESDANITNTEQAEEAKDANSNEKQSKTVEDSADDSEEDKKDTEATIALYEAFISGENPVKVHTDIYDAGKKEPEGEEVSYFGENEGYNIIDLIKKIMETESDGMTMPMFKSLSYAVIDCGLDDNPELALMVEYNQNRDDMSKQIIIKDYDGELQLVDIFHSDYVQQTTLKYNGKIEEYIDKLDGDTHSYVYAYLDSDCNFNFAYEEMISKTGYSDLDDRFDPELIYGEDAYKPAFLKAYSFTQRDYDNYPEWRQNRWYCVEKTDADPDMDIDYEKNEEEFGYQFKIIGDRLHSMDEINKKIKQIETDLSLTDELKADVQIEWIECDVDKALINPAFEYDDEGVAPNVLTINPGSLDNIKWVDDTHVDITDQVTGETYHLSYEKTILDQGIPCADYDEDCISWIKTYLEHNTLTDEDVDSSLYCRGFAPGDIWEIKVDDNNNIWIIYSITYWD